MVPRFLGHIFRFCSVRESRGVSTVKQLSQNWPNPNFDEHEQTSHIHFFDILEVPKSIFKKYSIGGPFR